MALAAESKGLGICYMGSTLANCDEIGRILQLPPGVFPMVGFSMGYPEENPPARDRLPLDGLFHFETYHDYTDERISEIYRDREIKGWERYMTYPRLRRMVQEAGVENLAQIYTVVKYTHETHEQYSTTVLDYLISQDFMSGVKII